MPPLLILWRKYSGHINQKSSYEGVVITCGMVNSGELNTAVFPFILKGIQLIGIDSVEILLEKILTVWKSLGGDWKPQQLNDLPKEISLKKLPKYIEAIYNGKMQEELF